MASLTLEGISKQYRSGQAVLDSLDLEIRAGEFLVLVGPSGSGKSTLLRIIAGLEPPSSGEIRMDGERISGRPAHRRGFAMVFQDESLYPHLTVYQNLAFGLNGRNPSGSVVHDLRKRILWAGWRSRAAETDHQIRRAADWLGITSMLNRLPHQLSGGERQRVALGRAFVRNPAAFLLDEPLSGLDPHLRRRLAGDLLRMQRELQATTVMVTHDAGQACWLADRIAVLSAGRLLQVGTPEEIHRRPASRFVADLAGETDLNLLEGDWSEEGGQFRTAAGTLRFGGGKPPGLPRVPVRLGFRAEECWMTAGESGEPGGWDSAEEPGSAGWVGLPSGTVRSVEFHGSRRLVVVEANTGGRGSGDRILWRVSVPVPGREEAGGGRLWKGLEPGLRVQCWLRSDRCLWFDRDTEMNLLKDA